MRKIIDNELIITKIELSNKYFKKHWWNVKIYFWKPFICPICNSEWGGEGNIKQNDPCSHLLATQWMFKNFHKVYWSK
jgi:hypothetical protein